MNKKRFMAVILVMMMVLSFLPASIYADEGSAQNGLSGKLKITGTAAVGETLQGDLTQVLPEGLLSDNVYYEWFRKTPSEADYAASEDQEMAESGTEEYSEDMMTSVSTQSSYTVTEEDTGNVLVLKVTAKEELGIGGVLYAKTKIVGEESPVGEDSSGDVGGESGDTQGEYDVPNENPANVDDDAMQPVDESSWNGEQNYEVPDENQVPDENEIPDIEVIPDEGNVDPLAPDNGEPETSEEGTDSYEEGSENLQEEEPVNITADPSEADWGTIAQSDLAGDQGKLITLTNQGTGVVKLLSPSGTYFSMSYFLDESGTDIMDEPVEVQPGGSVKFRAIPNPDLEAREEGYEEYVRISDETGEIVAGINMTVAVKADEPVVQPVYSFALDQSELSFGTMEQSALGEVQQQTVSIFNTGNQPLVMEQPEAVQFQISVLEKTELEEGESVSFGVVPRTDLQPGTYQESLTISTAQDPEDPNKCQSQQVILQVQVLEDAYYSLTLTPQDVNFGNAAVGYQQPQAQTVEVFNGSNRPISLTAMPAAYFTILNLPSAALEAGTSASFQVVPNTGLQAGNYTESIAIAAGDGSVTGTFTARFTVQGNILVSIVNPDPISNLANGTANTAQAMGLPSTVTMNTSWGAVQASVTWDMNSSGYNPDSTSAQHITVRGTVALPEGITNPNNVGLGVSVDVTVMGYNAKVADPAKNQITGIDTVNGYAAGSQINFTAVGAGMDNTAPGKGDVRYVPLNWTVKNTYAWKQGPYTGAFKVSLPGDYKVSVTFNRQVFDGSNWVADGQQDVKSVSFRVYQSQQTITPTPTVAPNSANANQKTGVATGDRTPILLWVIVFIIAAACVAGVAVYLKKRK